MVRIERIRERRQNNQCVCDLQVSTVAELPALNANVNGVIILPGSIAEIVQTGDMPTLDDDGKWYAGGSEIN
jgi:hypothetical protein